MSFFKFLEGDSVGEDREVDCTTRRDLLIAFGIAALGILGASCQRTVTRHRSDGTPYDDQEDDWVATLAAIIILAIIVAAIAANQRDDDDAQLIPRTRLFDGDDEEIIDSKDLFLMPGIRSVPRPTRTLCKQAQRYFQTKGIEVRQETSLVAVIVPHTTRPDAFVLESLDQVSKSTQPKGKLIVRTPSHAAHAIQASGRIEIALVPRVA